MRTVNKILTYLQLKLQTQPFRSNTSTKIVPYISHTTNKHGMRAYVIYGRAGEQPTLIKVIDRLQWLRVLEIEECSQDSL